jgi:predicted nucleic acid-binding protein
MFLIDTNIISELKKPTPNAGLLKWFDEVSPKDLYLSVITLGEIRKGIEMKKRKDSNFKSEAYEEWLNHLIHVYKDRIIQIDKEVVNLWGIFMSISVSVPAIDGLIAASAKEHDLTLVTRNTKDFKHFPVNLYNPFND